MASKLQPLSAAALRREISRRNQLRARQHPHEATYGAVPSIVFQENEGLHGNFIPASYQAILRCPEWSRRLRKSYTAGKWIPRRHDRTRCELDCANSSDALLMNILCYPGLLRDPRLCALLGIETGLTPVFGYKPRIPLEGTRTDQTEMDVHLGHLLIEAKLTETSFQTAPLRRIERYRDLRDTFDVEALPVTISSTETTILSYQLIRGVLAARHTGQSFLVLSDSRRADLVERWFQIIRTVRDYNLRSRLAIVTWQELSAVVPRPLQIFLKDKYGIFPAD